MTLLCVGCLRTNKTDLFVLCTVIIIERRPRLDYLGELQVNTTVRPAVYVADSYALARERRPQFRRTSSWKSTTAPALQTVRPRSCIESYPQAFSRMPQCHTSDVIIYLCCSRRFGKRSRTRDGDRRQSTPQREACSVSTTVPKQLNHRCTP